MPTLASTVASGLVLDLLIILAAASAVTMLMRRLRLATIPAYIITGAIIGPAALKLVSSNEHVTEISDLAILLLMFTIGLHLDLDGIRGGLVSTIALGVGSTLATVILGWPLALAAGLSPPAALAVAMALSMSSTAVVLRLLQQRRETQTVHGRICFGVLIVQDLLALVILAALPPLATWAGAAPPGVAAKVAGDVTGSEILQLAWGGLFALAGVAVMIAIGRYLLPRLMQEAAKDTSAETLLVLSGALALGAAVVTQVLGFSAEFGAFLAGFVLASTPFRHQLAGQLAPMRDLFMAVYFTAVGLTLDLNALVSNWWLIALALPVLLAVKGLVIGVGTWLGGSTAPIAVLSGLSLCQAGEFSLVIVAVAAGKGIIPDAALGAVIAVVVLSLILTPGLFELGHRIKGRFAFIPPARCLIDPSLRRRPETLSSAAPDSQAAAEPPKQPPATGLRHVIIAGFGVVGRNLAEHFGAAKIPFTVVELNPLTVRRQRQLGRSIIFGDIANPEVLESAGIRQADAVILTIPDDDATLRACRTIREMTRGGPGVFIAARTSYLSRAMQAAALGADHVSIEEVATARDMAEQVMRRLRKLHPGLDAQSATRPGPSTPPEPEPIPSPS